MPPERAVAREQGGTGRGAEADLAGAAAELAQVHLEIAGQDGEVVLVLSREHAELGGAVGGEGAVAVEVIGREVEQHGGLRRERHGVLELERGDLADHGGIGGGL